MSSDIFISPISVGLEPKRFSQFSPQKMTNQGGEGIGISKDQAKQTAQDFEESFIAQMLKFSGLDKALTSGGGEGVEEFAQFYLEELAAEITEKGGFGLTHKIESYIKMKDIINDKTG